MGDGNKGDTSMKIMGFIASPRNEGNTAWMVNKIREGAKEQGAETQAWYAGNLAIQPCKGCRGCVQSGRCVIDDDMQQLYHALKQADALILGSPVYMGQMSAQAKIFTDRLVAQFTPRFSPTFKEENAGKKMILAFTQGNPDPQMFQVYFDYTKSIFQMLEFDVRGVHVIAGLRNEPAGGQQELHAGLKSGGAALVAEKFSGSLPESMGGFWFG
ncbi:MAG: flavodoxin family protein [Planctomycetaceae bacterium]|jgi:multimeric flavodoxin WrbA|nr:flavodoxin family protein [Planctomycetaceae bacterium]